MSLDFGTILRGLMDNRRLSVRAVSHASQRAESTIRLLLDNRVTPSVEVLHDLAPALQLSPADLMVIAGVAAEPEPDRQEWDVAAQEIGALIAVAAHLTPEQVDLLLDDARSLRAQNQQ